MLGQDKSGGVGVEVKVEVEVGVGDLSMSCGGTISVRAFSGQHFRSYDILLKNRL